MNEKETKDQELTKALNAWQLSGALPPRFREGVWGRIERMEKAQVPSLWEQISGWVNELFAKPAVAVGYVSALLAIGLVAGHFKSNRMDAEVRSELASKYLFSVDPFQKSRHQL